MRERIERRIEQLQQEKEEIRIGAILRDKEIDGQILALREVIAAIDNEQADPNEQHEDHGPSRYDIQSDECVCPCGARKRARPSDQWKQKELAHVG